MPIISWNAPTHVVLLQLNVLGLIAAATLYIRVLLRMRRCAKTNQPIRRWDWVKLVFAAVVLFLLAVPEWAPISALYNDAQAAPNGASGAGGDLSRRMVFE